MSDTQVALLRGINVGRAKRVAMADLRKIMAELGFGQAKTLLNSGNVVYSAPASAPHLSAARIEAGLVNRIGIRSRVTVLTEAELGAVIAENPLVPLCDNPSRLFVSFLNDPADRAVLAPLLKQDWTPESLAVGTRAAYMWCPDGIAVSPLAEAVGRPLADRVTTRNWSTVLKLQALAQQVA